MAHSPGPAVGAWQEGAHPSPGLDKGLGRQRTTDPLPSGSKSSNANIYTIPANSSNIDSNSIKCYIVY